MKLNFAITFFKQASASVHKNDTSIIRRANGFILSKIDDPLHL
jgi:hypothetical protein